jgi:hypothetical protein
MAHKFTAQAKPKPRNFETNTKTASYFWKPEGLKKPSFLAIHKEIPRLGFRITGGLVWNCCILFLLWSIMLSAIRFVGHILIGMGKVFVSRIGGMDAD